eukprot:scaffold8892_cov34-Phaeocystis_antarctica.AAC.1
MAGVGTWRRRRRQRRWWPSGGHHLHARRVIQRDLAELARGRPDGLSVPHALTNCEQAARGWPVAGEPDGAASRVSRGGIGAVVVSVAAVPVAVAVEATVAVALRNGHDREARREPGVERLPPPSLGRGQRALNPGVARRGRCALRLEHA